MARTASAGAALLSAGLALVQLRKGWLKVPSVAIRAHPARRALDLAQFAGTQEQKLVRFACSPLDADAVPSSLDCAHSPDTSIRDPHTITYGKATCHLLTSSTRHVTI
jgi:hypothetical protein